MITNLNLPNSMIGPSAVAWPVSTNPGGAVIFVDSGIGLDTRRRLAFQGTAATTTQSNSAQGPYGDPNKPMASVFGVNGALTACVAGRGDLIVCLPGHIENLPAGNIAIPSCVSILGIGYGNQRPLFNYNIATSSLVPSGPGVQINNCVLDMTQVAAVTLGMSIAFNGVQLLGCRIIQASAVNQCAQAIKLLAGADDFLFSDSEIDATAAAGATIGIGNPAANAINRCQIANSLIHGDFSTSPVSLLTTTNKEILIQYNVIRQFNAAKTVLNFAAGATITGIVQYNTFFSASAALHTDFLSGGLGAGMGYIQNFGSSGTGGMNGKSAILIPDAGAIP